MLSQVALGGIWAYQRYLSPRKGFRCAHSVLHGGTGCSGFAKFAIRDHGIWRALPLIRARFAECGQAHATLMERRAENTRRRKKKGDKGSTCGNASCTTAECGMEGCAFFPAACRSASAAKSASKSSICDTNPCDGDVGCGGCDINICACN